MTAYEVAIRKGVFAAIDAAKTSYELNDADVAQTYVPKSNLEDMADRPIIKVVAIGHSTVRNREYRKATIKKLSLPVQIALQQRISEDDVDAIDRFVYLAQQVRETVEDDELVTGESYSWDRTEPLTDIEGNTFDYQSLIQKGVFQVIFTVYYDYVEQASASC